jgi:hypothetical protein
MRMVGIFVDTWNIFNVKMYKVLRCRCLCELNELEFCSITCYYEIGLKERDISAC